MQRTARGLVEGELRDVCLSGPMRAEEECSAARLKLKNSKKREVRDP